MPPSVHLEPPILRGGLEASLGKLGGEVYRVQLTSCAATPFTPLRIEVKGRVNFGRLCFVRMHRHGPRCCLFSIEPQSSKLLVARSILVSRSMYSITYRETAIEIAAPNGVTARNCLYA